MTIMLNKNVGLSRKSGYTKVHMFVGRMANARAGAGPYSTKDDNGLLKQARPTFWDFAEAMVVRRKS